MQALSEKISIGLVIALVLALSGCGQISYYSEIVAGHLDLMSRRRPITELLANKSTPDSLRVPLKKSTELLTFSQEILALPAGGSFTMYADLGRPMATWVIFANAEFSLDPLEWCFPITGCLAYRGFFSEENAKINAKALQDKGMDVYIGGSPAYSTLGWFDDPILNTYVHWPEDALAGLIFHELAHQKLYIQDDTTFNESYAEAVSRTGVRRWLTQKGGKSLEVFENEMIQHDRFVAVVRQVRERLRQLYQSSYPAEKKRTRKQAILAEAVATCCLAVKESQPGMDRYRPWFAEGLNNAKLASVNTYDALVPAFLQLLKQEGNDMQRFHQAVAALGALPKAQRLQQLQAIAHQGE